MPACVRIDAARMSSECSASTPAVRYSTPTRVGCGHHHLVAVASTTASSPASASAAALVVQRRRPAAAAPRASTARVRRTRSAIRPAFQSLHAAGPVAAASAIGQRVQQLEQLGRAADAPRRRSSIVIGSSRSRRVAVSGSSRWWRTSAAIVVDVVGRRSPSARRSCAACSAPTTRVVAAGSPCRCRAAARRPAAGRGGRPRGSCSAACGRGLEQVPVDGEAVHRVVLGPAAHRVPLRDQRRSSSPAWSSASSTGDGRPRRCRAGRRSRRGRSAGHGSGTGAASVAEPLQGERRDGQVVLGGGAGRPQHQPGVGRPGRRRGPARPRRPARRRRWASPTRAPAPAARRTAAAGARRPAAPAPQPAPGAVSRAWATVRAAWLTRRSTSSRPGRAVGVAQIRARPRRRRVPAAAARRRRGRPAGAARRARRAARG